MSPKGQLYTIPEKKTIASSPKTQTFTGGRGEKSGVYRGARATSPLAPLGTDCLRAASPRPPGDVQMRFLYCGRLPFDLHPGVATSELARARAVHGRPTYSLRPGHEDRWTRVQVGQSPSKKFKEGDIAASRLNGVGLLAASGRTKLSRRGRE